MPERLAVVVFAYNRPDYLGRALASIFAHHPGGDAFPVYVSQDGPNEAVSRVVAKHGARSLVHPRRTLKFAPGSYLSKAPGYAYLSVHYGWALRTLFGDGASGYAGVIILEDDIEVAPDFFSYFRAAAPLLDADPTLLCVSAWSDNGQAKYAADASALYRSDFFPGLGWLMTRRLWDEVGGRWPDERGFWDDWLREPPQRRGRASIRPEVSRTYTFGERGTSQAQFFKKYLGKIALSSSKAVDWAAADLSYLLKPQYDAAFAAQLAAAAAVRLDDVARPPDGWAAGGAGDGRLRYDSKEGYVKIAQRLGLMDDLKAGVPRTAYRGVVTLRVGGRRVFVAPTYAVDQDITKRGATPRPIPWPFVEEEARDLGKVGLHK